MLGKSNYFFFDLILVLLKLIISKNNLNFNSRFEKRKKQFNNPLYQYFNDNFTNTLSYGVKSIFNLFRFWFISFILTISVIYYFLVIRSLPFNKVIFAWFLIAMFLYWLISGFVFFIKKYRFSKFTTAIQRFWRRSLTIFWLIELFLFLIFFYFVWNANQEPMHTYDTLQVYKTHLFSWRLFIFKILPIAALIVLSYFVLHFTRWSIFSKNNLILFIITLLLVYIVWLEFYQFYHLLNYYGSLIWNYDQEDHLWFLESEDRRTRIVNNYVTICLIAKFWHIIFVFVFWVFFLLRANELNKSTYPLFTANIQNFIFLYVLSWIYMYPWIKFLSKKYLVTPYFWLFTNPRRLFLRILFNDIKLVYFGFVEYLMSFKKLYLMNYYTFYYFTLKTNKNNPYGYKRHFINDLILDKLV